MMNKKQYITPSIEEYRIQMQGMLAASALDPTSDTPDVIPTDDPLPPGTEFGAPDLGLPSLNPMDLLF